MEIRNYGKVEEIIEIHDLVQIQTKAYRDFLQADLPAFKRKNIGLEAIFREIFPISNYDGTMWSILGMIWGNHDIRRMSVDNYD